MLLSLLIQLSLNTLTDTPRQDAFLPVRVYLVQLSWKIHSIKINPHNPNLLKAQTNS